MAAGEFIRQRREEARMTQEFLAGLAGLGHQTTLSKIESGVQPLSFSQAAQIAETLGFSLDDLAAGAYELTREQAWAKAHAALEQARLADQREIDRVVGVS